MKFKHILLIVLAVLVMAFMQPLVSFLGGLTLLFGVGWLILRDLPPASQDELEHRLLGWLRRVRSGSYLPVISEQMDSRHQLPTGTAKPAESAAPIAQPRRSRAKPPRGSEPAGSLSAGAPDSTATGDTPPSALTSPLR